METPIVVENKNEQSQETPNEDYYDCYAAELRDNFVVADRLGQGSFGLVRLCISKNTEKEYAVKIVSKKMLKRKAGLSRRFPRNNGPVKTPLDQVYAEISILKKLHHPHIVTLHEVYDDENSDDLCMVFEFLSGGPVMPELPTSEVLPEPIARKYFIHAFLGMEYLHHQGIIHRDIKPENILLDAEGNAKLVDMGESIEFQGQNDTVSGTKGTRGFLAPELVDMDRTEDCRGIPVDIWALGITLYSMLFGDIPFSGQTGLELYENIAKQPLSIPEEPFISDNAKSMLHGLLQKDPENRFTAEDIRVHAWFLEYEGDIPGRDVNRGSIVSISASDIENSVNKIANLNIATISRIKGMLMRRRSSSKSSAPSVSQVVGKALSNKSLQEQSSPSSF